MQNMKIAALHIGLRAETSNRALLPVKATTPQSIIAAAMNPLMVIEATKLLCNILNFVYLLFTMFGEVKFTIIWPFNARPVPYLSTRKKF